MKNCVLWIDHDNAKCFEVPAVLPDGSAADAAAPTLLKRHEIRHHTGAEKDQNKHKETAGFFREVAASLDSVAEVLIVGPGVTKQQFRHYLQEQGLSRIEEKIVHVDTVDHPTDAQIVSLGRKYFRSHARLR